MLCLPSRSFAGALLIWFILAGCESKKAPATTETPAATAAPKLPDTLATAHAPLADRATEAAKELELTSGDVPAFHEPFEVRKTIASGLVVVEKSIQQPATAVIHDPWDIKETFSIVLNGQVIYRDTANGMTYDFAEQPEIRKQYPMWIPKGEHDGELLVAYDNRPSKELARRFYISSGHVAKMDTLPAFNAPAKDRDHDGKPEYAGFYDFGEEWDDAAGRHRMTYTPTLYYEVGPTGLVLDSALTQRMARENYGVFLGYKSTSQPGVPTKNLPKGSMYRH